MVRRSAPEADHYVEKLPLPLINSVLTITTYPQLIADVWNLKLLRETGSTSIGQKRRNTGRAVSIDASQYRSEGHPFVSCKTGWEQVPLECLTPALTRTPCPQAPR